MADSPIYPSARRLVLCCVSLLFAAAHLRGAVATITNGDRITGEVLEKSDDLLRLRTAYAGIIEIPWSEVAHLETGKTRLLPPLPQNASSKQPLPELDNGEPVAIDSESGNLVKARSFSGIVNLAMKFEDGSNDKDDIDADLDINYRKGVHRFRMLGQLEYDKREGVETTKDWIILPKYDRFLTEKIYLSASYLAQKEQFDGLNLRQLAGPALGYQFAEGKPLNFLTEVGVVGVDEDYVESPDDQYWGPSWFLKYERDVIEGKLEFYHRHLAILNAENTDKYIFHSWTGFRFPLVGRLTASTEFEFDYDSQPAIRAEAADTIFRLKFGYAW